MKKVDLLNQVFGAFSANDIHVATAKNAAVSCPRFLKLKRQLDEPTRPTI